MLPAMARAVLRTLPVLQRQLLSCRALSDSKKHVKSSSHAGNEKGDKSQVEGDVFPLPQTLWKLKN